MTHKLTISGQLPNLNDYTTANRANRYKGAEMKKQAEHTIGCHIKQQLGRLRINHPVYLRYKWYEPNKRRDKDNIAFAQKFIQDSLVKCGIIEDDGWNNIIGFSHEFEVDKKNPRIEVIIEEE